MQLMRSIRANGKVLLSGEYLVIQGAKSLAVPLKLGQTLEISEGNLPGTLEWIASDTSGQWFYGIYSLPDLTIVESSEQSVATRLQSLLRATRSLNNNFLSDHNSNYTILANLILRMQHRTLILRKPKHEASEGQPRQFVQSRR